MNFKILDNSSKVDIANLFTSVFSSSEGEQEGKLIGSLAFALATHADNQEIICIGAYEDVSLIGAIFFSRLQFKEPIAAYMLAPVAVSSAHQGRGVGKALIRFGLDELRNRSATLAVTYGDPAYYSKVGFQALSQDVIPGSAAPLDARGLAWSALDGKGYAHPEKLSGVRSGIRQSRLLVIQRIVRLNNRDWRRLISPSCYICFGSGRSGDA